jgi:hypothetical protein
MNRLTTLALAGSAAIAFTGAAAVFSTPAAAPHVAGTTIAGNAANDLAGTCTDGHFTRDGITFNFCTVSPR